MPDPGLILNEGVPVSLFIRGTVSDPNGCANLDYIVVKAYRSGVTGGSACTIDDNDCYAATVDHGDIMCSGVGDTDATYEVEILVRNFADPTDSGSEFEAEGWVAEAVVYDIDANSDFLTNNFEVQSLGAFDLNTNALNYGTLSLGQTSVQKTVVFTNTGNRLVDAYVEADDDFQSNLSGFDAIRSTAVHYSLTDNFAYGAGTAIEVSPTQVLMDLNLAQQTDDATPTTEPGYFLLQMPSTGVQGTYTNVLTFTAYATPFLADTPTITLLSQDSIEQGSLGFNLDITGTDFPSNAVVRWAGSDLVTTYIDSAHLSAAIPTGNLVTTGNYTITVYNPGTGNSSDAVSFSVGNPAPDLTAISPTFRVTGSAQTTLTLTGTGFMSTSQVKLDGSNRSTTFVSSTQLTAIIPTTDMTTTSTHSITVTNPAPGGGTSSVKTFEVYGRTPLLNSVSPTSVATAGVETTFSLTGVNFAPNTSYTIAYWDATVIPGTRMTYIDSNHIDVRILASQMTSGSHTLRVYDPWYGYWSETVVVPVGDPYTVLLLHMNGSQGDTNFMDNSISYPAHVMTATNVIQTYATTTLGGDCGQFTGTSNDYLSTPGSSDWYFPGDFTIDFWANFSYVGTNSTFGLINSWNGSYGWLFGYHIYTPTNDRYFYYSANDGAGHNMAVYGTYNMTVGYWHHIALERWGNIYTIFVDGQNVGQTSNSSFTPLNLGIPLTIGKHTTGGTEYNFRGYIDEVRVSKGIARYQGTNFTRPTSQY